MTRIEPAQGTAGPPNGSGPDPRTGATTTTATKHVDEVQTTALILSQQVRWLSVHRFITPVLAHASAGISVPASQPPWPMVGTPAWSALDDADPLKWAALLDAAQHWALRVENCQRAYAAAGEEISAAANWAATAQNIRNKRDYYAARPWMKRGHA